MSAATISCAMCGLRFDPAENGACEACPLHEGCALVCCPNCGYSTIEPGQTRFGRFAQAWLSRRGRGRRQRKGRQNGRHIVALTELPVGAQATMLDFAPGFLEKHRQHLLAYGLVPGQTVKVLQRMPVTVIQVEYTELALESELAEGVRVEMVESVFV